MDLSDLGEPMTDHSMMKIERDPQMSLQANESQDVTISNQVFPNELHTLVNVMQNIKTDTPEAALNADTYDDGTGKRIRFNEGDSLHE